MAVDKADNGNTIEMKFDVEEKNMLIAALKTHTATVARKAAADAPPSIKELWHEQLTKIEALIRKVSK